MNILSKNMFVRLAGLMFAIVCVVSLVVLRLDNNEKTHTDKADIYTVYSAADFKKSGT